MVQFARTTGGAEKQRITAAMMIRVLAAEMPWHELRRARGLSQEMLAKRLRIKQPNVARLEKRTDICISTLRATIEAMGGTLDIVARFPDGTVKITNFSSIGENEAATS